MTILNDQSTEAPPAFPQLRDDPLAPPPVYVQWREETPAKLVTLQNGKTAWVVTRQQEARQVFEDPTVSRDPSKDEFPQVRKGMSIKRNDLIMNHMDPPLHGKFRRMLAPWFTMKKINEQREDLQKVVDQAIDRLLTFEKPVNFHKEFSLVIPSTVICRVLGIDYSHHVVFERTATFITRASSTAEQFAAATKELFEAAGQLVDESVEKPGGGVLQVLTDKMQAGEMTREQAVAHTYVLIVGGHETTAHTISLGFLQLFRDPSLADFLRENPDRIPDAVTEMLRIQSINDGSVARITTQEMNLGGVIIPAGAGIIPLMSPAHRDPRAWDNPDVFDIDRDNSKHLALGGGIHSCLGQNLARAELEIVFETVLRRIPTLRLAGSESDIGFQRDGFVFGVYDLPRDLVIGAPTGASQQVEVALGFHRTLEAGDFDAFEALFTTDAVNELPFHSPVSPPEFVGAAAIAADYRKMISNRRDLEFTIHTVTTDESENRVVLEFSGRSIIGETGALYEQDYVGVFTIDGSQISRLRLYADPQRAAKALQPIR